MKKLLLFSLVFFLSCKSTNQSESSVSAIKDKINQNSIGEIEVWKPGKKVIFPIADSILLDFKIKTDLILCAIEHKVGNVSGIFLWAINSQYKCEKSYADTLYPGIFLRRGEHYGKKATYRQIVTLDGLVIGGGETSFSSPHYGKMRKISFLCSGDFYKKCNLGMVFDENNKKSLGIEIF